MACSSARWGHQMKTQICVFCQICNRHTLHIPKWQARNWKFIKCWRNTCLKKPYCFRLPSLWKMKQNRIRWQVLAENIGRCDEIFLPLRKVSRKFLSINQSEESDKKDEIYRITGKTFRFHININKTRICCKLTSHIWSLISCRVVTTKHTQPTNYLPALQDIILVHCQAEGCFCF